MASHFPTCPSSHPRNSKRGFALLITITLLAFLVLLLVSLASLTRVETQVANNNQQLSQARQNALLALNIAIGQLQKYAGPDQRVTTTADLLANKDKAGTATPSPLQATTVQMDVKPGSRQWTAVWGNNETSINYTLRPNQIPPTAGNRRGVTPGLLNWLISGNESAAFTPKGTAGGVNPGTGITYTPADAVDLTDLANPTVKANPAVVLIGANSVGTGAVAQKDYVVAPLVEIKAAANTIPGADPTSSTQVRIGRYAWWVGDEGVKARINLQNGYQQTGQASDQINSFITGQRAAIEFMDRDPVGTANPARIGSDFDFTTSAVSKIFTTAQIPLTNVNLLAQTRLTAAAKNRFHDLTTQSYGVLSDTYAGGLKKDLTADIADTSASSSYRPANDAPVFTPINPTETQVPTWGLIRNWARTNPGSPGGAIGPILPSATNGGFYPTIAYFSLGYNFFLEGSTLKMAFYPIISLHNPYPVAIAAADYEVGLRFTSHAKFTVQLDLDGDTNYTNAATINLNDLSVLPISGTSTATPTFIRLRIHGRAIPAGERHLYVLPDSLHNTAYNHNGSPLLERAPDTTLGLGESNYFTLGSALLDLTGATPAARIRLRVDNSYIATQGIKFTETSLVLAENNSLSSTTWNPTASTIYQGVHGVYPSVSHLINFGGSPPPVGYEANSGFFCTTTAVGDLLSAKQVPPSFANSAFRIATGYESGGWWSSQWKMGFLHPYYPSRVVADGTLRAPNIMATALENYDQRPDGNNRSIDQRIAAGIFGVKFADANQDQGRDPHPAVVYYRYSTGVDGGPDNGNTVEGTRYAILWDILDSPDKLLSLGQLQHVPFSRYDFQPSYLFGNSYANKRISRNSTYRTAKLRKVDDPATAAPTLPLYDDSWLLNRAMWDKYFVSGVPTAWTQADIDANKPLPNARMTYYRRGNTTPSLDTVRYTSGANRAYDESAANLMVSGSFNINSTSEQAWRAILASTYRLPLNADYASASDTVEACIPYPRFTHNLAQAGNGLYPARPVSMKPYPALTGPNDAQYQTKVRNTLYLGNRGLFFNAENNSIAENTSAETVVAELARAIVQEIRFRGPFLSLADFINRPLTASSFATPSNPTTVNYTPEPLKIAGIKGVLQAGMDNMNPAVAQVNPVTYQQKGTSGFKSGSAWPYYDWDSEHAVGGFIDTTSGATYPSNQVHRSPFAMAPKMLTQADILSSLGPVLNARSDTFTIRAYGEKTNPVTGDIEGKAWCEAVLQRTPDFVDSSQAPSAAPAGVNVTYGRRFQVVSFRWLTPQDI